MGPFSTTVVKLFLVLMLVMIHNQPANADPSITEFIQDTVHPGDRGALQISIPTTGVYSELKLELYDASTGNLVRGKDVCQPITSTLFTGGIVASAEYLCVVANLRPMTDYLARVRGYLESTDTLSDFSANFTFQTGYLPIKAYIILHPDLSLFLGLQACL
ncbi:uncharacterized protein LOC142344353 [Convolutriloba macropyga]|uniref:uncharacterized protein LOC142344353 n=1 Tax=Convolutriloba macropyga TaxID=536237 RepID=UPI003F51F728